MAARPLVTQEGVLAVDLVPLKVGPDLFEPGPDQVAAVERDMRALAAPDGQQFAFDVAGTLEAVVALPSVAVSPRPAVSAVMPAARRSFSSEVNVGLPKVTRLVTRDAKFAPDSPLEGHGIEPSVPREIGLRSVCKSAPNRTPLKLVLRLDPRWRGRRKTISTRTIVRSPGMRSWRHGYSGRSYR
jgi:hypothetical protein